MWREKQIARCWWKEENQVSKWESAQIENDQILAHQLGSIRKKRKKQKQNGGSTVASCLKVNCLAGKCSAALCPLLLWRPPSAYLLGSHRGGLQSNCANGKCVCVCVCVGVCVCVDAAPLSLFSVRKVCVCVWSANIDEWGCSGWLRGERVDTGVRCMCVCFYAVCVCALECASSAFVAHLHFFPPSLYCVRVSTVLSVLYTACPQLVPWLRVCPHWRLRSHIVLPSGSGLRLMLHFKAPDCAGMLHIQLAYLDLPTSTEHLSTLSRCLSLSLTLTQACGDVSSSNEETSHRRRGGGEQTGMLIVLCNRWKESNKKWNQPADMNTNTNTHMHAARETWAGFLVGYHTC